MTQYFQNHTLHTPNLIKTNDKNTQEKTKTKKHKKERQRDPVSKEIYEKLIQSTDIQKFTGKRDYIVYTLLWALGLRINELKYFYYYNWKELKEKSKTTLYEPKNQGSKEVVISNDNQKTLQQIKWADAWFKEFENAPVLRSCKGEELDEHYTIRQYNKKIKPIGEKFNLKIRTHSFRIGLITKLLKNTDALVVKDIIGHKAITTTLRYNRGTTPIIRRIKALNKAEKSKD